MVRTLTKLAIVVLFAAALVMSGFALFDNAQAAGGPCICPELYAPVKCSNGKTYPNLCYATCAKAKNCVPTGDI